MSACSRNTTANSLVKTVASTASPSSNTQRLGLQLPLTNPRIVVLKARRELELYAGDKLIHTYKVGLGLNPIPHKQREGDRATPEGDFYVFTKNPKSQFHLSLGISYPNIEDAERGLKDGLITRAERNAIVRAINRKQGPLDTPPSAV
jgi:murein L,D-transpeptidase YafK